MKKLIYPLLFSFVFICGFHQLWAQPSNNDCSNAIPISVTEHYVPQTFSFAQANLSSPTQCSGNWFGDVWFSFVANSENITIVLEENNSLLLEVFSATCQGTRLYCNTWSGNFNIVNGSFIIGQTYYIRVSYPSSASSDFKIGVSKTYDDPGCTPESKEDRDSTTICNETPLICGSAGICGSTVAGGSNSSSWNQLMTGFCGPVNSPSFFRFTASSSVAQFVLFGEPSPTSTFNILRTGLFSFDNPDQLFCNQGDVTFEKCYSFVNIDAYGNAGIPIYYEGLTVGKEYYVITDGHLSSSIGYRFFPISGIEVEPKVVASAIDVCQGDSVLLRASGGDGTYQWDNSSDLSATTGDSIWATPSNLGPNTYSVESQNVHPTCAQTANVTIQSNAPVTPDGGADQSICINDTLLLTGSPNSSTNPVIWTTQSSNVELISGTSTSTVEVKVSGNGPYIIEFGEASPGCPYQYDQVAVSGTPLPNIDAGSDFQFCNTDSVDITASGGIDYSWSHGLGNGPTKRVLPTTTTTFYVTGSDGTCSNTDSITLTPDTVPELQFHFDTVCAGAETIVYVTGANFHFWTGFTGSQDSIIVSIDEQTTFDVLGVNDVCSSFDIISVDVHPIPTVTMDPFPQDTICRDNSAIPLPEGFPAGGSYSGTGVIGTTLFTSSAPDGANTVKYSYMSADGCRNADSSVLFIQDCLGLEKKEDRNRFSLSPNPTTGIVHLSFEAAPEGVIELLDLSGRLIQTIQADQTDIQMDLTNWSNGIYIVRYWSEGSVATKRLVIAQ